MNIVRGGEVIRIHLIRRWFKVYGYCPALGIRVVERSYGKVFVELCRKMRDKIDQLTAGAGGHTRGGG